MGVFITTKPDGFDIIYMQVFSLVAVAIIALCSGEWRTVHTFDSKKIPSQNIMIDETLFQRLLVVCIYRRPLCLTTQQKFREDLNMNTLQLTCNAFSGSFIETGMQIFDRSLPMFLHKRLQTLTSDSTRGTGSFERRRIWNWLKCSRPSSSAATSVYKTFYFI